MEDWHIRITPFSDFSHTKEFSSLKNTLNDMNSFISSIRAYGDTDLHGTMYDAIKAIESAHSTILLFTDGDDNVNTHTQDEVIEVASKARQENSQFAMYTMGIGKALQILLIRLVMLLQLMLSPL